MGGKVDEETESPPVVRFAVGLYGLDAIKKAAYRLSDQILVEITPGAVEISCAIRFRRPVDAAKASELRDAFTLEVLDQDLRATIGSETEAVRNLILAYAFSKTGLQGE